MIAAPRRRARRDAGYVTVMVLTFAGLMAALVAATLHVARPSVGQAVFNLDDMQAEGLLEAGVAAAGFALYGGSRKEGSIDPFVVAMGTGDAQVSIAPEGGRIDLNGADTKLLQGFYDQAGAGAMKASEFAGRVADWRDGNSKPQRDGAEAEDYQSQGLSYGPRNGPFQSVEELLLLPGVTQEEFTRLEPFLTVYNPEGSIDPAGADMTVLMSVPRMTSADATSIKEGFANPDSNRRDLNTLIESFRSYLTARGTDVFRVRVDARLKNGFTKSVEAVLMGGDRKTPYVVLYWRVIDSAVQAS